MFMYIIDVTDPITLLLLLAATLLLIFLGKEVKKPYITAIPLVTFLLVLIYHCVQLGIFNDMTEIYLYAKSCITVDLVMILLTYLSYLWVDNIAAKAFKKKSIDDSLDWFWNKI